MIDIRYNSYDDLCIMLSKVPTLPTELGKRERERLVHSFTHERGSLLAHIFPQF